MMEEYRQKYRRMKKLILCALCVAAIAQVRAQEKWEELFDGKTLTGWTRMGGKADFRVIDGTIVGTTAPDTPNSFLCTEREYGNFILELEFRVDEGLNSGVQFRSQFVDELVRGYQYEIDPDRTTMYSALPANRDADGREIAPGTAPRSWTGGIYDEKRRGWIGDLTRNPEARAAFRPGEWNKIRIEARKDLLKTWINGVHAATVIDYMTPNGFIALQVHAVPEYRKMRIAWRNIRIQNLGANPPEGDRTDPLPGEWKDASTGWLAQIYRDGQSGQYKVNLSDEAWANKAPLATLTGRKEQDGLLFANDDGYTGRIAGKRLVIEGGGVKFDGQRIHRVSPTLGAEAPEDAIVLFDGNEVGKWGSLAPKQWLEVSGDAAQAVRITPGGAIEMIPGKGSIITRETFRDFHLHLEFRLLGGKTNGGVYLMSRYELNIKDSWGQGAGAPTGALGNILTPEHPEPARNYALPPMVWQTMDIDFRAPRFDAEGRKSENACVTMYLNGELIYDRAELDTVKGAAGRLGEAERGPIYLQEHGTAYQFRNIWIRQTGHKEGDHGVKAAGRSPDRGGETTEPRAGDERSKAAPKAPGTRKPANRGAKKARTE